MNRLYVPSLGPTDWRRLLADPEKHWKPQHSALELAVAWEAVRQTARGLPQSVCDALDTVTELRGASLVIGLPEHVVELEGGGHGSQNDLWALLRVGSSLVSMTVEAKAGETFDDLVSVWLTKKSSQTGKSNKPARLAALQRTLGIGEVDVSLLRYQLLHRAASALAEADRFRARFAVVLVQSFGDAEDRESHTDFCNFASLMMAEVPVGELASVGRRTMPVPLYVGWVPTPQATIDRLRDAV